MSALREFWSGLTPRDRRVLAIGAGVLLVIGLWLLVWEPLRDARDAARLRVASAAQDLAYLRAVVPQLRDAGTAAPRDGRSLLATVDATARESGVGSALLRVEPVSSGQVRVYFEGAGFDALVDWLAMLQSAQGVTVGDLSVSRAGGVGRVDARVVLEREGG